MHRMAMIDPETAEGKTAELLQKTKAQLGRVPNLYRAMSNSPAALDGYLQFRNALVTGGILDNKMRERIALLTAQQNGCGYCISAHVFRGQKIGIADDDLDQTRSATSSDPKTAEALLFVSKVMATRGDVADADLDAVRAAGWSDSEISEMVAHVALNVFSNYFNHVARPELDFPKVT